MVVMNGSAGDLDCTAKERQRPPSKNKGDSGGASWMRSHDCGESICCRLYQVTYSLIRLFTHASLSDLFCDPAHPLGGGHCIAALGLRGSTKPVEFGEHAWYARIAWQTPSEMQTL